MQLTISVYSKFEIMRISCVIFLVLSTFTAVSAAGSLRSNKEKKLAARELQDELDSDLQDDELFDGFNVDGDDYNDDDDDDTMDDPLDLSEEEDIFEDEDEDLDDFDDDDGSDDEDAQATLAVEADSSPLRLLPPDTNDADVGPQITQAIKTSAVIPGAVADDSDSASDGVQGSVVILGPSPSTSPLATTRPPADIFDVSDQDGSVIKGGSVTTSLPMPSRSPSMSTSPSTSPTSPTLAENVDNEGDGDFVILPPSPTTPPLTSRPTSPTTPMPTETEVSEFGFMSSDTRPPSLPPTSNFRPGPPTVLVNNGTSVDVLVNKGNFVDPAVIALPESTGTHVVAPIKITDPYCQKPTCNVDPLCTWQKEQTCKESKNNGNWETQISKSPRFFDKGACLCDLFDRNAPDRCDMAEQEYAALLLNIGSKKLDLACQARICGRSTTVASSLRTIYSLLAKRPRSEHSCTEAMFLASAINSGSSLIPVTTGLINICSQVRKIVTARKFKLLYFNFGARKSQTVRFDMQASKETCGKTCVSGKISPLDRAKPVNYCFVVDVSGSTRTKFSGTGGFSTILDAEIASIQRFLNAVKAEPSMSNGNVGIGLVKFNHRGTYVGNFAPLRGNIVNPDLLRSLQAFRSGGGTSFDGGLSKSVECFQNRKFPTGKNVLVFLSDGQASVRSRGSSALRTLDRLKVERTAIGVGKGSVISSGSGLATIDNTGGAEQALDGKSLDGLILKNPIKPSLIRFRMYVNFTPVVGVSKSDVVDGIGGYSFNNLVISGVTDGDIVTAEAEFSPTSIIWVRVTV